MLQITNSEQQADKSQTRHETSMRRDREDLVEPKQPSYGNQALLRMGRAGAMPPVALLRPSQTATLQRKIACDSPISSLTSESEEFKGNKRLQAKLTIGASNDPLEREADLVAEQVLRMPDTESAPPPQINRKCTACEEEGVEKLQTKPAASAETVNREAPAAVHEVLRSRGQPLDASTRTFFEPRFGYDFSDVRIYTDEQAADSASDINALAFTSGRNIVFGAAQYNPSSDAGRHLLAHELTHVLQQTAVPFHARFSSAETSIQRQEDETPIDSPLDSETSDSETDPSNISTGLIVDDEVEEISPEQMRRSEFLDQLRAALFMSIPETFNNTVEQQLDFYRNLNSQRLEKDIHRYIPDLVNATSADDYILSITSSVGKAIISGDIPEEANAESNPISNIFFKGLDGSTPGTANAQAVQAKLGSGSMLEKSTQSRMESAFGHPFSNVRVHTDSKAEGLAAQLNARAFTIGKDIAFGNGEYQPGTLIGDALIAHELAHVVQQRGSVSSLAPQSKGGAEHQSLEEDADLSAVAAILSILGGATGILTKIARTAMPSLRSGLRLSSCCKKEPIITHTLDVFELAGHSLNPESEVTGATRIWTAGARIQFDMNKKLIDEPETRRLIGTEPGEETKPINEVSLDYNPMMPTTDEMSNLKSKKGSKGSLTKVFFVADVRAGASHSATDPLFDAIYIGKGHSSGKCASGFTLGHELGHIFLGKGHDQASPLMSTRTCQERIDDDDCETARRR